MVITKEIAPPSWRRVLDNLSRLHVGATAHLVVLDDEQGPQTHGDDFRLLGLTADGDPGSESISAILSGGARVTHIIDRPSSLHIELLWESRTANVQVTDRNGRRTLICLGPPVLPDVPRVRRATHAAAGPLAKRCDVQPPAPGVKIPLRA